MKKKRILKDPETGEIVGATRTPFSRQAKEMNKEIFAEEFEKKRVKDGVPEGKHSNWSFLIAAILLVLSGIALWVWKI